MCQDVEIVGEKAIPKISLKKYVETVKAGLKEIKKKQSKKKVKKQVLAKDVLAVEIVPSNSKKTFILAKSREDKRQRHLIKQSFETICPTTLGWFLDK